jgi:hypothetical protein
LGNILAYFVPPSVRRHDTQHGDIQHNYTQHNDVQRKNKKIVALSIMTFNSYGKCRYAEYRFMLSVAIKSYTLSALMLECRYAECLGAISDKGKMLYNIVTR